MALTHVTSGARHHTTVIQATVVLTIPVHECRRRTPDEWIPRHPDLVRLTGRHPFNVEPPLSKLMEQGFITPAALHYVRNHGANPDPLIPCLHAARSG